MPLVAFHCSHEQIPPSRLLRFARHAEEAGFDGGMSSDHFSPWSERQGESGFAWSFLGAAMATTSLPFGVVNAPGQRYHPAIVAQAAATLTEMFPGRLWVALGSGEASNEHITGAGWPPKDERNARLRECVEVMRALFAGEEVTHHGHVEVDRARLWTLPTDPPPLIGAAVSEDTARWAGSWADGLATVNAPPEQLRKIVAAYRDGGGQGRLVLQVHLSWAPTEEEALRIAHDQWRTNVFDPPVCWDVETVEEFDRRAARRHAGRRARQGPRVVGPRPPPRMAAGAGRTRIRRAGAAPRRPGPRPVHRRLRRARASRPPMSVKATSDLWWKNAVFYCLDIETFYDLDGDGCGDLAGLTERVDYLGGLGVSCIWLMPFYSSPNRDDGYDIVDFYAVDPAMGTLGDLVEFVRTARDRGIRVVADFVMNHTSDQHPWFQSARESPDSPYRDFYVWRDKKPDEKPGDVVFPDQEDSNWAWDKKARQWYLHRFYSHQPDLNMANPQVRDEVAQVMAFWLEQGLSGFRVDAVPFMIEPTGLPKGAIADPHALLRDLRAHLNRRDGEAVLLGEVNLPAKDQRAFVGDEDGDELHMLLDFLGNQALYLALARGEAEPLAATLREFPDLPPTAALGRFVRNHDELTLDKLSDDERAEVFDGVRPRSGPSAVRARAAPPAADDAGRRRARDPHGVLALLLAARHAGAVLRRGDRHGREPGDRRPAERAVADAVVGRAPRRLLDGRGREGPPPAGHRGSVRPRARERGRPATRPRIAAELVRAPDPPPP